MKEELESLKLAEKFFEGDINILKIWQKKYGINGETPHDIWKRISKLCSEVENESIQKEWENKFYEILKDWKFVPGGRILFGLSEDIKNKNRRKVSLSNCFVMPSPEDNLESIMDIGYKMAKTYSQGGGCGVDMSNVRPKGSKVNNSAVHSDGVVPFMSLYSNITNSIAISGRRGALMISIDGNHPDILQFINSKRDLEKVNYANISVKLTDDFFKAVIEDKDWELYFKIQDSGEEIKKSIRAKEIFDILVRNNWESAEPGIIYWDRVKESALYQYDKYKPITVNPCSEIFLSAYGSCLLGSINLAKFVKFGFTKRAEFEWKEFENTITSAVRLLDNVIELQCNYNLYPFKEQMEHAQNIRQMGMGVMGLADMFVLLGIKYDSQEALDFTNKLFTFLRNNAYNSSCELAKEKGSFKEFDKNKHLKSEFINRLPIEIKNKISDTGIRNIALLALAPTGSISLLASCSSGIEPIFQLEYDRRIKLGDNGSEKIIKVYHPLYQKFIEKNYDYNMKNWTTAHDIDYKFRIEIQSIIQANCCNAISSTINLPSEAPQELISDIYLLAWKKNLKGITVYRDGCREGVLLTKKKRPSELVGKTYQIKTDNDTYYITINDILEGIKYKPFEIFINSKTDNEYLHVITRLVSAIFRRTNDVDFVIKQLRKSYKSSDFLLKLADILEKHFESIRNIGVPLKNKSEEKIESIKNVEIKHNETHKKIKMEICPECQNETLEVSGGCKQCKNPECGWGACSV